MTLAQSQRVDCTINNNKGLNEYQPPYNGQMTLKDVMYSMECIISILDTLHHKEEEKHMTDKAAISIIVGQNTADCVIKWKPFLLEEDTFLLRYTNDEQNCNLQE